MGNEVALFAIVAGILGLIFNKQWAKGTAHYYDNIWHVRFDTKYFQIQQTLFLFFLITVGLLLIFTKVWIIHTIASVTIIVIGFCLFYFLKKVKHMVLEPPRTILRVRIVEKMYFLGYIISGMMLIATGLILLFNII